MGRPRRVTATARAGAFASAVVTLAALVLVACGGSSPVKRSPAPRSTPPPPVSAKAVAGGLLVKKDVGKLLNAGKFHRRTAPLYCEVSTAPTFEKASGATGVVGATFGSKKPSAAITEEVYLYPTAAAARTAITEFQNEMDCTTGRAYHSDGSNEVVAVGAALDYSARLTAEYALGWTIHFAKSQGGVFAMVNRSVLVVLTYTTGIDVDTTSLPDGFNLAGKAYDRIAAVR